MLTMIQVHHIKFLYEEKGYSLRKIANETGHDFKIVQKYVEQQDFNLKLEKRKTVSKKIDDKDEIMDWLIADLEMPKKQRHTGKRVFDRLKEVDLHQVFGHISLKFSSWATSRMDYSTSHVARQSEKSH